MSLMLKNVTVTLGQKKIIENISFGCKSGEVVALLGLNGAGKTTLIKTIAGLIPASNGEISINGSSMHATSLKEKAKRIAYVPQQMSTPFDYEVEDFVLMGVTPYLGVFEMPKATHREQVKKALESLQISHLRKKRLFHLSGGEKQMVYLARAMVQEAGVMVLDEPTAYLDFKRQHAFLGYLRNFVKENDKLAVLSVHDPNLALQYADQIIILHEKGVLIDLRKGKDEDKLQKALDILYDGKAKFEEIREHRLVIHRQ